MLIAHLPAGYLLTTTLLARRTDHKSLWIGLAASVAPDVDLLFSSLLPHRTWTHYPFLWLCILLASLMVYPGLKRFRLYSGFLLVALPNILLHLLLDTLTGSIRWLAPFSERRFSLFQVPAVHETWVFNYIFHWTFLFEVFITVAAIFVLLARCDRSVARLDRFDDGCFGRIQRIQRSTIDTQPDSGLSSSRNHGSGYSEVERSSAPG